MLLGGTDSGATGRTVSPEIRRASLLVARMRSRGQILSKVSASAAQSSMRCSQLSRTSNSSRGLKYSASRITPNWPDRSWMPSTAASRRRSARDRTALRVGRTRRHPASRAATSVATCSASRVFPTPPSPVNVTSRDSDSRRRTSARSCRRPTNAVSSAGRLKESPCTKAGRAMSIRVSPASRWHATRSVVGLHPAQAQRQLREHHHDASIASDDPSPVWSIIDRIDPPVSRAYLWRYSRAEIPKTSRNSLPR